MATKKVEKELRELTPDEVKHLEAKLLGIRKELLDKADSRIKSGAYQISRDDLSDDGDKASVEAEKDLGMTLAEHERSKLQLVERALKKIESKDGSYGLCEGTGDPIGLRRLEVQPWAVYSLRYQEEIEKGRRGA